MGSKRIAQLYTEDQRVLGNNVLQAADGSESQAKLLVYSIANDAASWPKDFVAGIIEECFVNDKNEVRFKLEQMQLALRSLTTMAEDDDELS